MPVPIRHLIDLPHCNRPADSAIVVVGPEKEKDSFVDRGHVRIALPLATRMRKGSSAFSGETSAGDVSASNT